MIFLTDLTIQDNFHLISLWKIKKILVKNIANQFNTFFANIGPDLPKKNPKPQDKNMESYLKEIILCSFNNEPAEQDTVKIIKRLNAKHSSGEDDIP